MDENYEWDADDVYPEPGDGDGEDSYLYMLFFYILVQRVEKKHEYINVSV